MNPQVRTDERTGQPSTWIARERMEPGHGPILAAYLAVGVIVAGALVALGLIHDGPLPSENEYDSFMGTLLQQLSLEVGRVLTAVAGGFAVSAWGLVARRLYHSNSIGFATMGLLALDTGFLVQSHLVQPLAWELLFSGIAVMLALQPNTKLHWFIPLPLALYGLENRTSIILAIGLFAMLVARGHIYATRKHVHAAFWQTLPGLTGLFSSFHWGIIQAGAYIPGPGTVHIHNPAIWYTGAIAAVAGVLGGLLVVTSQFRMARHPGRIQFRLQNRIPRVHGRILWNAILLPVALPALIMHLLGGIQALTEDSRAFRAALYVGVFAFALVYVIRFWAFLLGDATDADLDALQEILPWISFDN
ncbi:MAG: hypothetical protein ACPHK8_02655 [Thermoplasmatota archaeon]